MPKYLQNSKPITINETAQLVRYTICIKATKKLRIINFDNSRWSRNWHDISGDNLNYDSEQHFLLDASVMILFVFYDLQYLSNEENL